MTNEEDKTLEELEADYKAELSKKIQSLRESNTVKAKEDADAQAKLDKEQKEADELDRKEKMFVEFGEKFGIKEVVEEPIDPDGADATRDKPKGDWANFHAKYLKAKGIENREVYAQAATVTDKFGFAFTDSDDGCGDDISAWSPADVYCDLIWQAVQCGKQLSGVITQRACDINAGDGLSVQIKTISASSFPSSALGACECASCSSNVFATHTLTLARYDIYKVLCELDVFDVGDSLKASVVESMSRAFISGIDALIWVAIRDASPGFTETSGTSFTCNPSVPTTTCCSYGANLYKEIIELEARMRAAGYGPEFYLILHPRVATYLKYKEGGNYPPWVTEIVQEGNTLVKIGNIKVIEYCGATSCTNEDTYPIAVMLDPERAVGEAYGKQPHLLTDKDPIECDSTKLVYRTYIAVSTLETGAIGHIVNP